MNPANSVVAVSALACLLGITAQSMAAQSGASAVGRTSGNGAGSPARKDAGDTAPASQPANAGGDRDARGRHASTPVASGTQAAPRAGQASGDDRDTRAMPSAPGYPGGLGGAGGTGGMGGARGTAPAGSDGEHR